MDSKAPPPSSVFIARASQISSIAKKKDRKPLTELVDALLKRNCHLTLKGMQDENYQRLRLLAEAPQNDYFGLIRELTMAYPHRDTVFRTKYYPTISPDRIATSRPEQPAIRTYEYLLEPSGIRAILPVFRPTPVLLTLKELPGYSF
jgi:hypothetical protein